MPMATGRSSSLTGSPAMLTYLLSKASFRSNFQKFHVSRFKALYSSWSHQFHSWACYSPCCWPVAVWR